MKYLALGYDGNEYLFRGIEADDPQAAITLSMLNEVFGPEGDLMVLIEAPAVAHLVDSQEFTTHCFPAFIQWS